MAERCRPDRRGPTTCLPLAFFASGGSEKQQASGTPLRSSSFELFANITKEVAYFRTRFDRSRIGRFFVR